MADYSLQTWVDETGIGDGTVFTAARMNAMEAGIDDAAEHHKIGLFADMPAASAANKNWLYVATDPSSSKAGIYRSDGTAWTKVPIGTAVSNIFIGAGVTINSFTSPYMAVSVNWNSDTDRLIDQTRPAWRLEFDGRSGFDNARLLRAAATGGVPSWSEMVRWGVGASGVAFQRCGAGGELASAAVDNFGVRSNYDRVADRLLDSTKPSWAIQVGDVADRVSVYRAAPTAGVPTYLSVGVLNGDAAAAVASLRTLGYGSQQAMPGVQFVTSLPTTGPGGGALVDGQECYFIADSASGVAWHLKYRAAEAGSFKWYCVGGVPLFDAVDTAQTKATTAYGDLTTVGPSVTVPLAGDYIMEMSATVASLVAAGNRLFISPKKNAGATADTEGAETSPGGGSLNTDVAYRRRKLTNLAAGDVFKLQYGALNATSHSFGNRTLQIMPIRVG